MWLWLQLKCKPIENEMKWQWKLAGDFYFSFIYEIKAKVFATTRFSSDLTRHIDRRSDEYVKPLLLWNHHISDWPTAKQKKNYVHRSMKSCMCVWFDCFVIFLFLFLLHNDIWLLKKCISIFFARAHLCSKSSLKTYFSSDFMVEPVEIAHIDGNYVEIYSKALLPLCD